MSKDKLSEAIEQVIYDYRTQYPNAIPDVERVIAKHLTIKVVEAIAQDINRPYRESYLDALEFYNGKWPHNDN